MDRDCAERGRTVAQVLEQYHQTVRPMHLQYVEPSKQVADLIVHSTSDPPSSIGKEADSDTNCRRMSSLDVACSVLTNHLMVVANLSLTTRTTPYTVEEAMAQIKSSSITPRPT
jgi:hypothetical protein